MYTIFYVCTFNFALKNGYIYKYLYKLLNVSSLWIFVAVHQVHHNHRFNKFHHLLLSLLKKEYNDLRK